MQLPPNQQQKQQKQKYTGGVLWMWTQSDVVLPPHLPKQQQLQLAPSLLVLYRRDNPSSRGQNPTLPQQEQHSMQPLLAYRGVL
jgi:hypothetical protein